MTDEAVMATVCRREIERVAVLYERYRSRLFNLFRYLHYDREQSMNLTQQVFYRLLLYRHTYQSAEFYARQTRSEQRPDPEHKQPVRHRSAAGRNDEHVHDERVVETAGGSAVFGRCFLRRPYRH